MVDAFKTLQWDKIASSIESFAYTEEGKYRCLHMSILPEKKLEEELSFLKEYSSFMDLEGKIAFSFVPSLNKKIELCQKGSHLNEEEFLFLRTSLGNIKEARTRLSKASSEILKEYAFSIFEFNELEISLDKVFSLEGHIKDGASNELRKIRNELRRLIRSQEKEAEKALGEYSSYLTGDTLSIRNGHYVLPVSVAYKSKVDGVAQDYSSSKSTIFIEPSSLIRLNNEIARLKAEERQEIIKILKELSIKVGEKGEELLSSLDKATYLDFVQAKCLYGEKIKGHIASLSSDGSLFIPSLRHPLLDQEKAIPNDFSLTSKERVELISGPNAGGKTVALKSVGLAVILFETANFLPCLEGAYIPYFKKIYVDIGDNQSIEESLSTFSSHMKNIAEILSLCGGRDLLLLDEVGTGTSPSEGEAIAYGALLYILKKHSYAFLTSHYEGLKAFALQTNGVVNASMLFDEASFRPTFILKKGFPGESYGLLVASRYGLQEEVVQKAYSYMKGNADFSLSKAIKTLGEKQKRLDEESKKAAILTRKLQEKEKEFARKEAILLDKEKKIEENASKRIRQELEDKLIEAEAILDSLKKDGTKLHQAIEAKKKIENLLEKKEEEAYFDEEIILGDYVEDPEYGLKGRVSKIKGDKAEISTLKGMRFTADIRKLRKSVPEEEKAESIYGLSIDSIGQGPSLSLELNLLGMRVDEAINAIDSYLDRCRIKGFKRVRIIHGFGSGALRKATHEYLKAHSSFVDKFELAGEYEGGGGATVVYLK